MKRAFSYIRFSTAEQGKGDSFRRQYDAAKRYAVEHDLLLDETLSFQDEGVSAFRGAHSETGRLGEFLQAIRLGRVRRGDTLLIENLDRLSRQSAMKALSLLNEICEAGISVVTVSDGRVYDSETLGQDPTALMIAVLTFVRANEESVIKADRIRKSWRAKREKIMEGKPLTGAVPAWVELDKATSTLRLIEDRAAIVQRIFSEYIGGRGQHAIATGLNDDGIQPWGKGRRKAEQWHSSYIVKILDTDAVIGVFRPHIMEFREGKYQRIPLDPLPDYYPPVIELDTYNRVRELRSVRNTMRGRKAYAPLLNIYSRVARCQHCGTRMIRVNKGSSWEYLVCGAAKTGAKVSDGIRFCPGGYNAIPYQAVEQALVDAARLGTFTVPVDTEKVEALEGKIKEAEARKATARAEISNLINAIKSGVIKPDTIQFDSVPRADSTTMPWTVKEEIEMLEKAINHTTKIQHELKTELEVFKPTAIQSKLDQLKHGLLGETIDKMSVNSVLRALCDRIVINSNSKYIEFYFRHTEKTLSLPYGEQK